MSNKKVRFTIEVSMIGITLIAMAFLKGRVVLDCIDFHRDLSLSTASILVLFGIIGFFYAGRLWRIAWEIPEKFHNFIKKRRESYSESCLIESAWMLECSSQEKAIALLEEAAKYTLNSPFQVAVEILNAEVALKKKRLSVLKKSAKKMLQLPVTRNLGLFYDARCEREAGNHEEALSALMNLFEVKHTQAAFKERVANQIFLEMAALAKKGVLNKNSTDFLKKRPHFFKRSQLSILLSLQAGYLHEVHAPESEVMDGFQRALVLDSSNVEALGYLAKYAKDENAIKILMKVLRKELHWVLADALMTCSCGLSLVDKFAVIQKAANQHKKSLEALYCIARSALVAGLWGEALHYTEELKKQFGTTVTQNLIFLQVQIEKTRMDEKGKEAERKGKWPQQTASPDVFRCDVCETEWNAWASYCNHCGALKSLHWCVS